MPKLIGMAKRFHEWSGSPLSFCPVHSSVTITEHMDNHLALIADHGALLARVEQTATSPDLMGIVTAIWVDPDKRGPLGVLLLRASERWAKGQGAVHLIAASLPGTQSATVLHRLGYGELETHHIKRL